MEQQYLLTENDKKIKQDIQNRSKNYGVNQFRSIRWRQLNYPSYKAYLKALEHQRKHVTVNVEENIYAK